MIVDTIYICIGKVFYYFSLYLVALEFSFRNSKITNLQFLSCDKEWEFRIPLSLYLVIFSLILLSLSLSRSTKSLDPSLVRSSSAAPSRHSGRHRASASSRTNSLVVTHHDPKATSETVESRRHDHRHHQQRRIRFCIGIQFHTNRFAPRRRWQC